MAKKISKRKKTGGRLKTDEALHAVQVGVSFSLTPDQIRRAGGKTAFRAKIRAISKKYSDSLKEIRIENQ